MNCSLPNIKFSPSSVRFGLGLMLQLMILSACNTTMPDKDSSHKLFEAKVDEVSLTQAVKFNQSMGSIQADIQKSLPDLFDKYWNDRTLSILYSSSTGPVDATLDKNIIIPILFTKHVISDTEVNLLFLYLAEMTKVRMAEALRDRMCDNPRPIFVKQVSGVISNNVDHLLFQTAATSSNLISQINLTTIDAFKRRSWIQKIFPAHKSSQVERLRGQCLIRFSHSCKDLIAANAELFRLSENPNDYVMKNSDDVVMSENKFDRELLSVQRYMAKARTVECVSSQTLELLRSHFSEQNITEYRDSYRGVINRAINAKRKEDQENFVRLCKEYNVPHQANINNGVIHLFSKDDEAVFRDNLIEAIKIDLKKSINEYQAYANDYKVPPASPGVVQMQSSGMGGDVIISSDNWTAFSEAMDVVDFGTTIGQVLILAGFDIMPGNPTLGIAIEVVGQLWCGIIIVKDFIINPIKDDSEIAALKEKAHVNIVGSIFNDHKSGVLVIVVPAVEKAFSENTEGKRK